MKLPPLYKYLDRRGAELTLGNRTFKFAKPSDFNDIEDLTIQSIFPEEVDVAVAKIASSFPDVIVENLDNPPTCRKEWRPKLALLQLIYRLDPGAAEAVKEQIKQDPKKAGLEAQAMRVRCQQFLDDINKFMQNYRVLCVSTLKDSDSMWTEYAEAHKGIVLRVEPSVKKASKFQLFRPVEYRETRPSFFDDTVDFLRETLFGDVEKRNRLILEKIIYSKTLKWQHESEYRLAIPLPKGEDWNTLLYHPEEITELYLGSAMTPGKKEQIVAAAKELNPRIAVFNGSCDANKTLTFTAY
jgi:hypothetical protein